MHSDSPQLLGVWYASLDASHRALYLKIVYPTESKTLADVASVFSLDRKRRVRDEMWERLANHIEVGDREYLVLDLIGLAEVLRPLEPFSLNGQQVSALYAVGTLDVSPQTDFAAALARQQAFLQAMCRRFQEPILALDEQAILASIRPPHVYLHNEHQNLRRMIQVLELTLSCQGP